MDRPSHNLAQIYGNLGKLNADFRNKNLYPLIISKLVDKRVLDVGCGAGHLIYCARQAGFDVLGIESSELLVALSKSIYGAELPIVHMSADQVDTLSLQFDSVTMVDVLEHIADDRAILLKLRSVLRDAGRLIILVPSHPWLYGARDRLLGHFRRYSRKELWSSLEQTGYAIIETRYWNLVGVLPYLVMVRIGSGELRTTARRQKSDENALLRPIGKLLDHWFRHVENRYSFGCGLSLLCVAEKVK